MVKKKAEIKKGRNDVGEDDVTKKGRNDVGQDDVTDMKRFETPPKKNTVR